MENTEKQNLIDAVLDARATVAQCIGLTHTGVLKRPIVFWWNADSCLNELIDEITLSDTGCPNAPTMFGLIVALSAAAGQGLPEYFADIWTSFKNDHPLTVSFRQYLHNSYRGQKVS